MKYIPCASLFLCRNEILSYIALLLIAGLFVWDLINARDKK